MRSRRELHLNCYSPHTQRRRRRNRRLRRQAAHHNSLRSAWCSATLRRRSTTRSSSSSLSQLRVTSISTSLTTSAVRSSRRTSPPLMLALTGAPGHSCTEDSHRILTSTSSRRFQVSRGLAGASSNTCDESNLISSFLLGRAINDYLCELFEDAVEELKEFKCIQSEEESTDLNLLNLGSIAGHYYIDVQTISVFNKNAKPGMTVAAPVLADVCPPLRHEDKALDRRDNVSTGVREHPNPSQGGEDSPHSERTSRASFRH